MLCSKKPRSVNQLAAAIFLAQGEVGFLNGWGEEQKRTGNGQRLWSGSIFGQQHGQDGSMQSLVKIHWNMVVLDGSFDILLVQMVVMFATRQASGRFCFAFEPPLLLLQRKVLELHTIQILYWGTIIIPLQFQVKPIPLCNYRHVLKS